MKSQNQKRNQLQRQEYLENPLKYQLKNRKAYARSRDKILASAKRRYEADQRKFDLRNKLRKHRGKLKCVEYFGNKCHDCQVTFPHYCYDFHHVDASVKDKSISKLLGYKWERVLEELKKCIMLCSHCHRKRHWEEDNETPVSKG